MDIHAAIGLVLLGLSVGVLTMLTLWSRAIVERIAARGLGSVREFMRDRS